MRSRMVAAEPRRHDWETLRVMGGRAGHVPAGIQKLLSSETEGDAWAAYWELENRVMVQGQLFEASQHLVPVLLAALADDVPQVARIAVRPMRKRWRTEIPTSAPAVGVRHGKGSGSFTENCARATMISPWAFSRSSSGTGTDLLTSCTHSRMASGKSGAAGSA